MLWLRDRLQRIAPLVLATAWLTYVAVRAIFAKVGHPGAALDDAYIHFQYARAIAEGHAFRFHAGEPISTGATSFLWPAWLAVPYGLGLHGESILWAAWIPSFLALGALSYETYALARPLSGRTAALSAGAMTLAFGGFVWCAMSGMEVVPFAWVFAHSTQRACLWVEAREQRTANRFAALMAFAALAPLMRPEGAIVSIEIGLAVALYPRSGGTAWRRAEALIFVALALMPNLVLLALTGHAASNTAQIKLLFGNPYYAMPDAAFANARILITQILNGQVWSAEFIPSGGSFFAIAGLFAIAWQGYRTQRTFRAIAVLILALAMFVPCFYVTFLWNRLRYLWPFAPGWFIGLACFSRILGSFVNRYVIRAGDSVTALVAGGFVGAFAVQLSGVIEDAAQSASGISRQQVALGHWVASHLPKNARIGVNDTGAIAYFGHRPTFDIVGLTTPSEGRYWVAGAGSRLEHYERLRISSPAVLPTHFVVYPEWMAMNAVLGQPLHEAVVTDSTILGGQVMRVYEARWEPLGSGENPWTSNGLRVFDTLDVADLESEADHGYELLGAADGEQVAKENSAPASNGGGHVVVDGGRTERARERFFMRLPSSGGAKLVARVEVSAGGPVTLAPTFNGKNASPAMTTQATVEAGIWQEVAFDIPPGIESQKVMVDVAMTGGVVTVFHWWVMAKPPP